MTAVLAGAAGLIVGILVGWVLLGSLRAAGESTWSGELHLDDDVHLELDHPVPSGWSVVGAVVGLRCIDPAGRRRMCTRYAGDVMWWEARGILDVALDDHKAQASSVPRDPVVSERARRLAVVTSTLGRQASRGPR